MPPGCLPQSLLRTGGGVPLSLTTPANLATRKVLTTVNVDAIVAVSLPVLLQYFGGAAYSDCIACVDIVAFTLALEGMS